MLRGCRKRHGNQNFRQGKSGNPRSLSSSVIKLEGKNIGTVFVLKDWRDLKSLQEQIISSKK